MKKIISIVLLVLMMVLAFTACGGKEVSKIEITEGLKYEFTVGETPDFSAVKATITYNDNSTEEVTADDLTFSSLDTSEVGTKKLTITYEGKSVTIDVAIVAPVVAPTVESITLNVPAENASLKVGETFSTEGITANATMSDGTTNVIAAADLTFSTIDTTTAGEKTLTATYEGKTATATVTVHGIGRIEIDADSVAIREGEDPDLSGLVVNAYYTDGDSVAITDYQMNVEGLRLTVTYGDFSTFMDLVPAELVSIEFSRYTAKGYVKEAYSTANVIIIARFSNNTSKNITPDNADLTLGSIDTSVAGTKSLTATYLGESASVDVEVCGIASVAVLTGSLKNEVNLNSVYSTDGVRVTVVYSDGTTATKTVADGVSVSGTVDTTSGGYRTLTVAYGGVSCEFTVTVNLVELYGVSVPGYISNRETYKNNFKDNTQGYVVGDDNPYVFSLTLEMLDENDHVVNKTIPYISVSQVYLVEGTTETLVGTEYVTIDEAKNSFDFTDAAIGKTFKIVTRPESGFEEGEEADYTRSQVVTVVDGYNVYRAKELNVITNRDSDIDGDGADDQLAAVQTFLKNNGIARPEVVSGVVLHGNMIIEKTDLPESYFVTYNDGSTQRTDLYDVISLYNRAATVAEPNFTLYGNYFTVYSYNIPTVAIKGFGNNNDDYSNSEVFFSRSSDEIHSDVENYDHTKYTTSFVNLGMRDDDPNADDITKAQRSKLGLIGMKLGMLTYNVDNCVIEAYYISIIGEHDDTTLTIKNSKLYNAWQSQIHLVCHNWLQSDDDSAPRANHKPLTLNIENSLVAKCGGPVIISQTTNPSYNKNSQSKNVINIDTASEVYSYVTGEEAWFVSMGVNSLALQIRGLSQLVSLSASNQGMGATYTYNDKNKTGIDGVAMNLICVNMISGDAVIAGADDVDGKITIGGNAVLNMNDGENAMVETYIGATGGQAPVMQSSAGGVCLTDGSTGVYGLDFTSGNYAPASTDCFQGDYITLYFMGMGILLEYN